MARPASPPPPPPAPNYQQHRAPQDQFSPPLSVILDDDNSDERYTNKQIPKLPTAIAAGREMSALMGKLPESMMERQHTINPTESSSTIGVDNNANEQLLSMKSCRAFPQSCREILYLLDGNERCVDCGQEGEKEENGEEDGTRERLKWASVSYGTTLCGRCAFSHIDKAENKSRIKSLDMGEWTLIEMIFMLEGGNTKFLNYLASKFRGRRSSIGGGSVVSVKETFKRRGSLLGGKSRRSSGDSDYNGEYESRYKSRAASSYRKKLRRQVEQVSKERSCENEEVPDEGFDNALDNNNSNDDAVEPPQQQSSPPTRQQPPQPPTRQHSNRSEILMHRNDSFDSPAGGRMVSAMDQSASSVVSDSVMNQRNTNQPLDYDNESVVGGNRSVASAPQMLYPRRQQQQAPSRRRIPVSSSSSSVVSSNSMPGSWRYQRNTGALSSSTSLYDDESTVGGESLAPSRSVVSAPSSLRPHQQQYHSRGRLPAAASSSSILSSNSMPGSFRNNLRQQHQYNGSSRSNTNTSMNLAPSLEEEGEEEEDYDEDCDDYDPGETDTTGWDNKGDQDDNYADESEYVEQYRANEMQQRRGMPRAPMHHHQQQRRPQQQQRQPNPPGNRWDNKRDLDDNYADESEYMEQNQANEMQQRRGMPRVPMHHNQQQQQRRPQQQQHQPNPPGNTGILRHHPRQQRQQQGGRGGFNQYPPQPSASSSKEIQERIAMKFNETKRRKNTATTPSPELNNYR